MAFRLVVCLLFLFACLPAFSTNGSGGDGLQPSWGRKVRLSLDQCAQIVIYSKPHWNNTGILVEPGDIYQISVSPDQRWLDADIVSGPEGQSGTSLQNAFAWTKRVREANWFALIVTSGKNMTDRMIYGKDPLFVPRRAAEMRMFANDAWAAYSNNSGQVTVAIRRVK